MTTITGYVKDADGGPTGARVTFIPSADTFPYVGAGGQIYTTQPVDVDTDAVTGFFTVSLVAGNYTVTVSNPPNRFEITVPASGSYSYDQLVTTSVPLPFAPAMNGSPEGVMAANPGFSCVDALNGVVYWKRYGTGAYGWYAGQQL